MIRRKNGIAIEYLAQFIMFKYKLVNMHLIKYIYMAICLHIIYVMNRLK